MKYKTAGVSLSRQKREHWRVCYNEDREQRQRWRWRAPQEVIATICGRELMWAWESRVGTHTAAPPVCFGTGMKCYITLPDYMWLSHMHRREEIHTHTNVHSLGLGQPRSIQHFKPADIKRCYLTLCCPERLFNRASFLPGSLYGWLCRMRTASVPCGLATNQSCNTDRGNKSKEQSLQSKWPNPAVLKGLLQILKARAPHQNKIQRPNVMFVGLAIP